MTTLGEAPAVPLDDRGLAYGDGVFETLPAVDGVLCGLDRHLDRLARGCAALGFDAPCRDDLRDSLEAPARDGGRRVVKLIVTRGSGGRGYRPPTAPRPGVFVSSHAWPEDVEQWRAEGIDAVRLNARLGEQPALAGIKHLNRLDQVLAAAELARHEPAKEGVVCDQAGRPVCGVMANLFLVRGGQLITPSLRRCGIAGIIRETILDLARGGVIAPTVVREVNAPELDLVDEMFLTNSVRGVVPVKRLDGQYLGAAGPVTRSVQEAVAAAGVVA